MENRIKNYVESVFRDVPNTERASNIKSEILSNLLDKYNDLLAQGRDENEAYAIAISSGGDLSGIVADLKGEQLSTYNYNYEKQFDKLYEKQYSREKKKCAIFAGWFWPLIVCVYFLYSFLVSGSWSYSWLIFLIGASVEDFVAYAVKKSNYRARMSALRGGIWTAIVVVYFVLSFCTRKWSVTWIVFLLGVGVQNIVNAMFTRDKDDESIKEKD